MVSTLMERGIYSGVVYCGWGTTLDRMIDEYFDLGGEYTMIRHIENMAYDIVSAKIDEEELNWY